MKNITNILVLFFWFWLGLLHAQNSKPDHQIQSFNFNINYGNSFLEDPYVFLFAGGERTYLKRQFPSPIIDLEIDVYWNLFRFAETLIGVGYNRYSVDSHGVSINGSYQTREAFRFITIHTGLVKKIWIKNKLQFKIGGKIHYHYSVDGNIRTQKGKLSFSFFTPLTYRLTEKSELNFHLFYKHSISEYTVSRVRENRKYFPYSYGFGVGFKIILEKYDD